MVVRSVGRSDDGSVGCLVDWSVGQSVGWLLGRSANRSAGRPVGRSAVGQGKDVDTDMAKGRDKEKASSRTWTWTRARTQTGTLVGCSVVRSDKNKARTRTWTRTWARTRARTLAGWERFAAPPHPKQSGVANAPLDCLDTQRAGRPQLLSNECSSHDCAAAMLENQSNNLLIQAWRCRPRFPPMAGARCFSIPTDAAFLTERNRVIHGGLAGQGAVWLHHLIHDLAHCRPSEVHAIDNAPHERR